MSLQTWSDTPKGKNLRVLCLYRQGLSFKEIAQIFKVTPERIRQRAQVGYSKWRPHPKVNLYTLTSKELRS